MPKKRKAIPLDVRLLVLHESGYKCGNPICRHVITLDIHHLAYISVGGPDTTDNLLPLCPNCHALHHRGEIPAPSLRAWKMLLLALNEAFDRNSVDILLTLDKQGMIKRLTGDGVISLAPLVAAGLVDIEEHWHGGVPHRPEQMYCVKLSEKGKLLVESWKKGDQTAAVSLVSSSAAPHA